jgi:hypothetical protein
MTVSARHIRSDPLTNPVIECSPPVHRRRDFHSHPRRFSYHAAEEPDIEFTGLCSTITNLDFDTGSPQSRKASACHQWVRVGN